MDGFRDGACDIVVLCLRGEMRRTLPRGFIVSGLSSVRLPAESDHGMVHLDSGDFCGLCLSVVFADTGSRIHFGLMGHYLPGDWSA